MDVFDKLKRHLAICIVLSTIQLVLTSFTLGVMVGRDLPRAASSEKQAPQSSK